MKQLCNSLYASHKMLAALLIRRATVFQSLLSGLQGQLPAAHPWQNQQQHAGRCLQSQPVLLGTPATLIVQQLLGSMLAVTSSCQLPRQDHPLKSSCRYQPFSSPLLASYTAGGLQAQQLQPSPLLAGTTVFLRLQALLAHSPAVKEGNAPLSRRLLPDKQQQQQQQQQRHHYYTASGSRQRWLSPQRLTAQLQAANSPEQLLQLVQQHGGDFDHIHVSAAYTRAVKVCRQGVAPQHRPAAAQQLLSLLHQLAAQQQQQCGARQLANIIWSCGHLRCRDTAMLLLPVFLQAHNLQQAKPQHLSIVLWSVASLEQQLPPEQLQLVMAAVVKQLPEAKPQEVSNSLWAVATMGQQLPADQLQQLLQRFEHLLPKANPQDVANTLWAVATMGQKLLVDQLQQQLLRFTELLPGANPQDVSNTLWAVATMGQKLPADQLQRLVLRFTELLPEAKPQSVSNTVWACAHMWHAPLQL